MRQIKLTWRQAYDVYRGAMIRWHDSLSDDSISPDDTVRLHAAMELAWQTYLAISPTNGKGHNGTL